VLLSPSSIACILFAISPRKIELTSLLIWRILLLFFLRKGGFPCFTDYKASTKRLQHRRIGAPAPKEAI
jgi:hypothetical protein